MQNKKIFTMQRVISIVLVLTMLLSGVSQTGFSFGTKEVQAQQDQPTISTSISTHNGTVEVEEPEQLDPEPGDPEPTATGEPIIIPIETETPVVTPTEKPSETPTEEPIITTPEPSATPDPSLTPTPPVFETPPPTAEPTPKGTDGVFNWEDITIDGVEGVEITAYLGTDTVLNIPATLGDPAQNVISIGAHALQGKQLTFITLPYGLLQIGAYAFADNQLASILTPEPAQHIILPETLRYIQEFAFRDNNLTVLDIPTSVYSLGQGAFISNNLNSLSLHEGLQIIGNSVFELNQLVEVWMPNSITSMGTDVFALNGRYVKVVTDNSNIQTEYSPKGFGHVVNPITIIVKHHDPDGNMLISDKVLGADLSIPGEAFSVGVPVTYTPQEISGYMTESPVTFTPDCDGYILTLIYQPTAILPVISKTPIMIPPDATAEEIEVLLREGLTATDFQGNDITDLVTWTHDIDSAVPGGYTVTYTVTDQWGNTAVKQVEALVGTDWMKYPTCNGWVLGDFRYNDTYKILHGFSDQGMAKYNAGNRNVCLPGFNPNTLEKLTMIGVQAFSNYYGNMPLDSVDFSRMTELEFISWMAFYNQRFTRLDLSHNTKLKTIESRSFILTPLTTLDLSQNTALERIGSEAFNGHALKTIDLSQLSALTYIGYLSFRVPSSNFQTTLTLPTSCELRMIDQGAFQALNIINPLDFSACTHLNHIGADAFNLAKSTSIIFPQNSAITYIGSGAFAWAPITELDLDSLKNLEYLGSAAFSSSKMTELDFRKTPKLTHIGVSAFSKNDQLININFSESTALTYLGDYAFNSAKLTSLDLTGAPYLTHVGARSFQNSVLTSLSLPPLIRNIGELAFYSSKLTHLDLSNLSSLNIIGQYAFYSSPLETINWPNGCAVKFIGNNAFYSAKFTDLDLSVCPILTYIGDFAFRFSPLQTLQLDNPALSYIGNYAFYASTTQTLSPNKINNIVVIGESAFGSATVNSLDFSQNAALQYIGNSAFHKAHLTNLDLSNSSNLKYLGSRAFYSSTLDEVWISPDADFRLPYSNVYNKSSQLYTGLYLGITAIFRTYSGSSVMPSDPNGELVKQCQAQYAYNNRSGYSLGPYTKSEFTNTWPYSQQVNVPAEDITYGNESFPRTINCGGASSRYVVNPKDVTVYSEDKYGNTIADPYIIKTPGGNTYTVYPRPIFGYCTPNPIVVDLTVDNPTVTFVYDDISQCHPGDTTGIELHQAYNTTIKPGPYLIGDQMISRVILKITGYNAVINNPKIVIFYDPSVYDESEISVPLDPIGSGGVVSFTAENGVLTINLEAISGGTNIDIPVTWKFRKYVTPEFTPYPLEALFLNDGGHPLAEANPVDFQGYYRNPNIRKYTDGEYADGIILRHFTPSRYLDPAIDDVETEYVDFTFSVHNLERFIGAFTITDTLPVYPSMENGVESQRTAIFDPTVNPDWVLSADGTTVTYTGNAYNSLNIEIPPLRLRFPWAMYYYNIQNSVSGVLTPYNKSPFENDMYVSDSVIFSFGEKLSSIGIFDKDIFRPHYQADKAYFYDNDYDRHLDMPWELFINPDFDMYNVVLSDFDLDDRLYYSSAIVPEDFIGGTYHLIDANGLSIVVGDIISTEFSWSHEEGLMTERVEFHLDSLPAGFYQVTLNTRLVNPDIEHFDPTPGSTANVFWNTGALSYAISPNGESHYIEDDEELYVRQVRMEVKPLKTQVIVGKTGATIAFPGDLVEYRIFVHDQTFETFHDVLNNFVMIDLMPNGIIVTSVQIESNFRNNGGSYEIINDYNGTGRVGIVFSSPTLSNSGYALQQIASINAIVDPLAVDGDYLNEVFMDFNNTKVKNLGEQVWDHLQDPNDTMYSRDTTLLGVTSVREVRSFKAIRRADTDPWNYSGIETPAGGEFQYSLNVLNNTEEPRTNVVLVDVFPYINDTAITENLDGVRLPRGSEFANTFDHVKGVTAPTGYTVKYYNSNSPIVYGTDTTEDVLDNLPWSDTAAANTIAIRIEQDPGVELLPNSLLTVIVPMIAPTNNDLSLSGLRAYNTFVRKDDSTLDPGGVSRYLEPNRIYNLIPLPSVDIRLTKVGESPDIYLEGAVFELRDSNGVLVRSATTDVNGVINFLDIEIGDYTLTEVQAPAGYKLLPAPIIITQQQMIDAYNDPLSGGILNIGPISNMVKEPDPIRGSVIIEKVDANGEVLPFFEFTIEGITPTGPDQPGNTHIRMRGRTGLDGRIIFNNLPKGTYRITETRPRAPYHPVNPFFATIETQGQVIEFTGNSAIINDRFALRVDKLGVLPDHECADNPLLCNNMSGTPLPGVQFSLYAADGTELLDGPQTTNEQGFVSFPSQGKPGLKAGTRYILREVAGDDYYTPYPYDIHFMFDVQGRLYFCETADSCTTPFEHGQIYVPNKRIPQTGQVTVTKKDNDVLANLLEGAVFTIYRQLDLEGWEVVEVLTTNEFGVATSSVLPAGVYKIKETKAPAGYARTPLERTFVINPYPLEDEPLLLEFNYEFVNLILDMALIKYEMFYRNVTYAEAVDLLAAMAASCPECKIVTTDFLDAPAGTADATIVHIIKPLNMVNFALLDENKNQLETGLTDDGWLSFSYAQIDDTKTYYLRETSTPPGYRPIRGDIPVRVGDYTSQPGFNGRIIVPVENKLILGQVSLSKYNLPSQEGMAGVEFTLTYPDGTTKSVQHTDENGYIVWSNLLFGTYTLQETATIPGFRLDPTIHTIVIDADNPHIYIVKYNHQTAEDLPDTGTLGALGYLLGGITLLAAGFWFSKRWAKKEL